MTYARGRRRLPDSEKGGAKLVRYDRGANEKWGAVKGTHSPKREQPNDPNQTTSSF
jgi:hypothetical protein